MTQVRKVFIQTKQTIKETIVCRVRQELSVSRQFKDVEGLGKSVQHSNLWWVNVSEEVRQWGEENVPDHKIVGVGVVSC
jgi:hypothetical protein